MQQTTPRSISSSRTSREDWIRAARDILVSEGIGQVKILRLAPQTESSADAQKSGQGHD